MVIRQAVTDVFAYPRIRALVVKLLALVVLIGHIRGLRDHDRHRRREKLRLTDAGFSLSRAGSLKRFKISRRVFC